MSYGLTVQLSGPCLDRVTGMQEVFNRDRQWIADRIASLGLLCNQRVRENRDVLGLAGTNPHLRKGHDNILTVQPSLDEAALSRARRLVGLKGYVTNLPASVMPAAEVIASYHSLWQVEASFRLSKSDLRGRPIFHHERDAIEAHLTVVMAALAIARDLQDTTTMSIKRIVRALRPLQQITLTIAGHEHAAADPLTDTARDILTATGTTWPTH